jgi:tetratricopeptide (TPR) repeat protein
LYVREARKPHKRDPVNAGTGDQPTPTASELFEAAVAAHDSGSADEALTRLTELVASYGESSDPDVRVLVARALFAKADTLRKAGQLEDALVECERLDARFGGRDEPSAIAIRAANGLLCKALTLESLGRPEEKIATYDALLDRYANRSDPEFRARAARALLNKALTLKQLKRDDEVIETYERLESQFDSADEGPAVVNIASTGLLNHAVALNRLGRHEEEIHLYDRLANNYSQSPDIEVRGRVIRALYNTALTLRQLKRDEEVVAACERLDTQFGAVDQPITSVRRVSKGLVNRALALDRLGRHEEEIEQYDKLAARYRDSTDPEIRGRVVDALHNKAITLMDLKRLDEAIRVYDDLDTRFGGPDEPPEVTENVAFALRGKATMLDRLARYDEELQVCESVLARYSDATDPATMREVVRAFDAKATVLWILDRHDEAVAALDELLTRLDDASETVSLQSAAQSLERKGRILEAASRVDEALAAFDKGTEAVEGLSIEDRAPSLIEILFYKAEALRSAERTDEALILFSSAVDVYRDWSAQSAETSGKSMATVVRALLYKISILGDTGQVSTIGPFVELFLTTLGNTPAPDSSDEQVALVESDLAALLAETHAGDCWFQFATAEDDSATRDQMAKRAVDLYLRTLPWILDSLEPDEADNDAAEDEEDDDEEIGPFLAAMTLRSIADGYALLSIRTVNRAALPLPIRGLFEWACGRFGIDDWAAEHGHPLPRPEPTEAVEELLGEERTKMLEQLDTDETDLERKFASALAVAAWCYHLLSSLAASKAGREALRDQRLKGFAVTQIALARQWAAWANHCMEDAAGAAIVMLLMAQSLYLMSHADEAAGTPPHLSQAALRELLDDTDALEWLQERETVLPAWLVVAGDQ